MRVGRKVCEVPESSALASHIIVWFLTQNLLSGQILRLDLTSVSPLAMAPVSSMLPLIVGLLNICNLASSIPIPHPAQGISLAQAISESGLNVSGSPYVVTPLPHIVQ